MTKDLIKLLITEYQAYVTQVELVHRDVELMDGLNYVFVGLRHAGKSYLMYQRIAQLLEQGHKREEILYFNFEDDRIDSLDVTDLDLIKTCYEEMYDSRPIFFLDEVQLVDRWEKFARRLADQKYQPEFGISDCRFSCYARFPIGAYYICPPNNMDGKMQNCKVQMKFTL